MSLKARISNSKFQYASVHPTFESVLQHWFIVNGNGYEIDENGLYEQVCTAVRDEDDDYIYERRYLHEESLFNDEQKEQAIQEDIELSKRMRFTDHYKELCEVMGREYNEEKMLKEFEADARKEMVWVEVTDDMLTAEALYNDIITPSRNEDRIALRFEREYYKRAYPFCQYALIHHITEKNSQELIQLAVNLSKAWIKFLNEEIESEHWYVGEETKYEDEEHTRKQLKDFEDSLARLETYLK